MCPKITVIRLLIVPFNALIPINWCFDESLVKVTYDIYGRWNDFQAGEQSTRCSVRYRVKPPGDTEMEL